MSLAWEVWLLTQEYVVIMSHMGNPKLSMLISLPREVCNRDHCKGDQLKCPMYKSSQGSLSVLLTVGNIQYSYVNLYTMMIFFFSSMHYSNGRYFITLYLP